MMVSFSPTVDHASRMKGKAGDFFKGEQAGFSSQRLKGGNQECFEFGANPHNEVGLLQGCCIGRFEGVAVGGTSLQ